jgi:hypothetical protein
MSTVPMRIRARTKRSSSPVAMAAEEVSRIEPE